MRRISRRKLSHILFLFLLFMPISAYAEKGEDGHSPSTEGLMRGERLFYGLIDGVFETRACADCHNTVEIDTFNWNPDAWEIASKYSGRSLEEFSRAVLKPAGKTMSVMHESFNLAESDVEMIKFFLDTLAEEGIARKKPVINKIFLFLLLGAVLTWVLLEVFFLKKVRRRRIIILFIFLGALGWQAWLLWEAGTALGRQEGYEPDQPVKFSHQVHVTDNQIDCQYCHTTVRSSKSAGIPEVNVCWNCHSLVRDGSYSGKYEINKIVDAWESGKPIPWIRVHNLQDHVFFSHAQHVEVGKIECATCHGDIEQMHRVRQVSDLSMGWCINCHRDTEVQFFDNAFYEQYGELQKKLKSGEIDRVSAENTGGTECSKCHY